MKAKDYRRTAGGLSFDNFDIVARDGTTEKEIASIEVDFDENKIVLRTKKKTGKE